MLSGDTAHAETVQLQTALDEWNPRKKVDPRMIRAHTQRVLRFPGGRRGDEPRLEADGAATGRTAWNAARNGFTATAKSPSRQCASQAITGSVRVSLRLQRLTVDSVVSRAR